MRTIVVLGTGTDVGKTFVSRMLLELLTSAIEGPVLGLKPVESGVIDIARSDASVLASCSRPRLPPAHAFALAAPVSPHLAAQHEHTEISVAAAVDWAMRTTVLAGQAEQSWMVLETAGGVFSPLNSRETNATLAAALDPAVWLLVAPDRLGVLHDLTATLKALEFVARKPDLVLLNAPATPDASTGSNRAEIERLGIAEVAGALGRNQGFTDADRACLLSRLGLTGAKISGAS